MKINNFRKNICCFFLVSLTGCFDLHLSKRSDNLVLIDEGIVDGREYRYFERPYDLFRYGQLEIYNMKTRKLEEVFIDGRKPLEADGKVDFYLEKTSSNEVIYTPFETIINGRTISGGGIISKKIMKLSSNMLEKATLKYTNIIEKIKEKKESELQ